MARHINSRADEFMTPSWAGVLRGGHTENTPILLNRTLSGPDLSASRSLFFSPCIQAFEKSLFSSRPPITRQSKEALTALSGGTLNKFN